MLKEGKKERFEGWELIVDTFLYQEQRNESVLKSIESVERYFEAIYDKLLVLWNRSMKNHAFEKQNDIL